MEITNMHEHVSCYYYESELLQNVITHELSEGEVIKENTSDNFVLFVISGAINLSFGEVKNRKLEEKEMILIPQSHRYYITAQEKTCIIFVRIGNTVQLCNTYSIERLFFENEGREYESKSLPINQRVLDFITQLKLCTDDGLKCRTYLGIKVQEFFYLLRLYYTKDDLAAFLYCMLKNNIDFSNFVFQNFKSVKSVKQFATMSGYSLSGFEKRFKKTFGTSTHEWMKRQKANSIFKDICSTNKLFKDMSNEYGFSSPAHFNDFCKSYFGCTPGEIRRRRYLNRQYNG